MLAIVAHHYVVNSGVSLLFDYQRPTFNMVFLQLWGMWGKTAINVFVLISGYFMCVGPVTGRKVLKKILKLWLEVKFYKLAMFPILWAAGYQALSLREVLKLVFGTLHGVNGGFTASFIAFYMFIPFLNLLVRGLDAKGHLRLVVLLLSMFTICGTFFLAPVFHYCELLKKVTLKSESEGFEAFQAPRKVISSL